MRFELPSNSKSSGSMGKPTVGTVQTCVDSAGVSFQGGQLVHEMKFIRTSLGVSTRYLYCKNCPPCCV